MPAGGALSRLVHAIAQDARGRRLLQKSNMSGKHTEGTARRECTGRAASRDAEGRRTAGREGEGREGLAGLVLREHGVRVGLALGGVGGGDGVDDGLGLLVADFCGRVSLSRRTVA